MKNSGEQEKGSIIRVRVGKKNPSLGITVCHHSASLMMPNGDPRDRFFYPTLTLMIDSYSLHIVHYFIYVNISSNEFVTLAQLVVFLALTVCELRTLFFVSSQYVNLI